MVRADADDATFVQHDDPIRIHDGADALGNDENGSASGLVLKCGPQPGIGGEIER